MGISTTYSPDISQVQQETFESNFYMLAQQSKSKFVNWNIAKFVDPKGARHNLGRIGRIELQKAVGRNPLKQYMDASFDNRQFSTDRYTATVLVDQKTDVSELIADPTSAIYTNINSAKERVIDRVIASTAIGAVLVGAPNGSITSLSAASDGVVTVDATSGLTYEKILEITQNFINSDLDISEIYGSMLGLTGKENTALMGETEFINNDYVSARPVEQGIMEQVGKYGIALFAGNITSGTSVPNPVIVEDATYRYCPVLTPNSISLSMEVASLRIEQSAAHVDSKEITIAFNIGAMRNEGTRVQILKTTK